jgi:diguanylate cyclase (GGDEF)-like protein
VSEHHDDRPDLAFFICDLDDFKDVNDKFGHAAGNRALIEVARRLESACRKSDTVVRWGLPALGGEQCERLLDPDAEANRLINPS